MTRAHLNGQSTDERILLALKRGPQTVMELVTCLGMSDSTIRKALGRMEIFYVVRDWSRRSRSWRYRLSPEGEQRVALMEWRRKQA
jgi:hypothetical protein